MQIELSAINRKVEEGFEENLFDIISVLLDFSDAAKSIVLDKSRYIRTVICITCTKSEQNKSF